MACLTIFKYIIVGGIFNFNSVQRALVLEDYAPPALRVQGFVSRKKGARSMGEEKKEGKKVIIINKKVYK